MNSTTSLRRRGRVASTALALAATVALGSTACGDSGVIALDNGETHTFTLATGAMEGTQHSAVEQRYLDMIEERSEGRISFDRTSFEVVCKMPEIINCLRDGRADIGTTVNDYTPHLLPTLGVAAIPFQNTDVQATTAALYEMHTTYPSAVNKLNQNNLHYIASWPSSMFIGSKEPVDSVDDLAGLRARVAGQTSEALLQDAGVNVNAITAAETYESLQRGVIDSVGAALDFAVQYQVIEQLPYWSDPGLGHYTSYGMYWSKDAYDSLPEDLQAIVDEATEDLNRAEAIDVYNTALRPICDAMLASDAVKGFSRWDEEAIQKWREAAGGSTEDVWLELAQGQGLEGADEYLAAYQAAYQKNTSADNPTEASLSCVDEWQEKNR